MNELLKYTYEGSEVTFSNGNNVMVNATQMAKAFGKRPNDWLSLPSTKEFLDELPIQENLVTLSIKQL